MSLFTDLMALCTDELPFYFSDQVYPADGCTYRIFSYRLSGSYTNWLLPNALNCRGTMFRKDPESGRWELVCLPMPKCFRLGENPIIQEQEKTFGQLSIFEKVDGSLISTFIDYNGDIGVKSRTSLHSEHAKLAKTLLDETLIQANVDITKEFLKNNTDNFELVSERPEFRIVVGYPETGLVLLNSRSHQGEQIVTPNQRISYRWQVTNVSQIVERCESLTGKEGYIVYDDHHKVFFKVKSKWYDELHRSKFSFTIENIVRLILTDGVDDYLAIHKDDIGVINRTNEIVDKVVPTYNKIINKVHHFVTENKSLSRREFAITASKELQGIAFSLAMNQYLMRNQSLTEINDMFMKHWKDIFDFNQPEDNGATENGIE